MVGYHGGVATLLKEAHHNQDTNISKREINLSYGLKDKHASIYIIHPHHISVIFHYINLGHGVFFFINFY
jgi:hypothetical protein